MPLTRTLINELVWPAFKAAKSYVKPLTANAVKSGAHNRIATVFRRPILGDLPDETLFQNAITGQIETVGGKFAGLENLEDFTHWGWNTMRDSKWQFNKELDELGLAGRHLPPDWGKARVEISPTTWEPESFGAHEGAHHIYSDIWNPKHVRAWNETVQEHGKNIFTEEYLDWMNLPKEQYKLLLSLKSHPRLATSDFYKGEILRHSPEFLANTEALAFTMQDVLTPGREITAPLGLIRGLERIFDARGLIDRVAHRLPPLRRI